MNPLVILARLTLFCCDCVLTLMANICAVALWVVQRFGTEQQTVELLRKYVPSALPPAARSPLPQGLRIVRIRAPEVSELGRPADPDDLPN